MRLILVALVAALVPASAGAQSFLGYRALGLPVGAADARAVALGNLGIGLPGVQLTASDPASAAALLFPTVSVSMQPSWGDFDLDGQTGTARTTRFPMIGIAYPVPSAQGTVTLSLSGHMELRWAGEQDRIVSLGGLDVPVNDASRPTAAVRWRAWAGRRGWATVLAGGHRGHLRRQDRPGVRAHTRLAGRRVGRPGRTKRTAHGSTAATPSRPGSRPIRTISFIWRGAAEWSGELKQKPRSQTEGDERAFSIPLRLSAGATGRLSERLHVNTSVAYQDWSTAQGFEAGVVSTEKLSYGRGAGRFSSSAAKPAAFPCGWATARARCRSGTAIRTPPNRRGRSGSA